MRCAVYTRKSSEHNLDLAFTSLDAQREACEAYIRSQAGEGWRLVPEHFDDGGLSGISESNSMCRQKIHLFAKSREFGFRRYGPDGQVLRGG
jgi:DNA invertase Pin-like site-specific DNA recombinase